MGGMLRPSGSEIDVMVGAGAAGLAADRRLAESGRALRLDARGKKGRPGGRPSYAIASWFQ